MPERRSKQWALRCMLTLLLLIGVSSALHGAALPQSTAACQTLAPTSSLIVFGDSITAGQAASSPATRWINLVGRKLGAKVFNEGMPGTVLQDVSDTAGVSKEGNGRGRLAEVLQKHRIPSAILIIAYGFNDARYIGSPETMNADMFRDQLTEAVQLSHAASFESNRIVIVSPYWISDIGLGMGSPGFQGQSRRGFEAYVQAASDVARNEGVPFADVYAAMAAYGADALISADHVHPNDTGHMVIADTVLCARRPQQSN